MRSSGNMSSHLAALRSIANVQFGSRTDRGCVRDHNEDSLVVAPPLFAVADGMGGHAAGEVASEIAVSTLAKCAPVHANAQELGKAVEAANHAIIDAAARRVGREGMGTTCTSAVIENNKLVIAHVGDSRAYLLSDGRLVQITRDHSYVADMVEAGQITPELARLHPKRSLITRALGNDPHMKPDLFEMTVQPGDRLLLCSDGLTTMLLDDEIEALLIRERNPQRCARMLVNAANEKGGFDNITAIVVDIQEGRTKRTRRAARKTKIMVALLFLLVIGSIAGGVFALDRYLHTTAYLASEGEYVAIYEGVPGSVLGVSHNKLIETTTLKVDDLPAGTAERVRSGMRVDNVAIAHERVDAYKHDLDQRKREEAQ